LGARWSRRCALDVCFTPDTDIRRWLVQVDYWLRVYDSMP